MKGPIRITAHQLILLFVSFKFSKRNQICKVLYAFIIIVVSIIVFDTNRP